MTDEKLIKFLWSLLEDVLIDEIIPSIELLEVVRQEFIKRGYLTKDDFLINKGKITNMSKWLLEIIQFDTDLE